MTTTQGYNANGEVLSSAFAEIDRANPDIYLDCSDQPSLTRQEFAEDCNINTLMAQYDKTGVMPPLRNGVPQYLDLSDLPDLQGSLTILADAQAAFMRLPATVRREMDNDPAKFINYASDPANADKLREWGLAAPLPIEPAPQKVEIVNPPVDKSAP